MLGTDEFYSTAARYLFLNDQKPLYVLFGSSHIKFSYCHTMSIDWLYSCSRSIFCYFSLLPLFFLFSRELGCDFLRVDVVFYDIPAITIDAHVLFSLLKLSCLWWCRWKEQVRQCNSNFKFFFSKRAQKRILPSDWFLAQSVFSYLCPRAC